jgi:hypothetical protein
MFNDILAFSQSEKNVHADSSDFQPFLSDLSDCPAIPQL